MLSNAFPKHAAAIEEYSPFVSTRKKDAYYKAWEDYYQVGGSVRFFDFYISDGKEKEQFDIFLQRTQEIFKFAGTK